MRRDESGSVLIWAFMSITLFILLVTAMMASGAVSLTRAKQDLGKSQGFYTAKGVLDTVSDALVNAAVDTSGQMILDFLEPAMRLGEDYDSEYGAPAEEWALVRGLPAAMGQCRIRIRYEADTGDIAITAYVKQNADEIRRSEQATVLTLIMSISPEDMKDSNNRSVKWTPYEYREEEP